MLGALFGTLAAIVINPTPPEITGPSLSQVAFRSLPAGKDVQRALPPIKRRPESLGVKTSGQSVFVADVASGKVLFSRDPHRVMPVASLTKLVTAMVYLDYDPGLTKTITMQEEDFDQESKAVFETGEVLTAKDVFGSMLVGSVNASANALARTAGGKEEFVRRMNDKVKELNLKTPVFVEPSGVDPRNRASAADVAAILSISSGYPKIREFAKMGEVTVRGVATKHEYKIKSTNLLLGSFLNREPFRIVAAKTGSLPEAGYCMAQMTSSGDGHEIVAVELGSDNHFSRYQDIKALTAWAFDTYEWR